MSRLLLHVCGVRRSVCHVLPSYQCQSTEWKHDDGLSPHTRVTAHCTAYHSWLVLETRDTGRIGAVRFLLHVQTEYVDRFLQLAYVPPQHLNDDTHTHTQHHHAAKSHMHVHPYWTTLTNPQRAGILQVFWI